MDKSPTKLNLADLIPNFSSLGRFPETHDQLSAIFIAALISVAVIFFIKSLFEFIKALKQTLWLKRQLKNESKSTLVKNRANLLASAKKTKFPVGHLWYEFDETLVEINTKNGATLYNIFDASHFFNSSTLAGGITDSRLLAAVPGFLTALGVVGTFVGLQLGLAELNLGEDASSVEIKAGVAHVIDGAKIAFITSVWGVALSVLFNFAEKILERIIRKEIHVLQRRIDKLFPRLMAEAQLKSIAEDGHESREALQGLAERIGQKMQESMLEMTTGIQQGLDQSLSRIVEPLLANASNTSQDALNALVGEFLEKFGAAGNEQREAMTQASEQVQTATEMMTHSIEGFSTSIQASQIANEERDRALLTDVSDNTRALMTQNKLHEEKITNFLSQKISALNAALDSSNETQSKRESALTEKVTSAVSSISNSIENQEASALAILEQGRALQSQIEASFQSYSDICASINTASTEIKAASELMNQSSTAFNTSTIKLSEIIQQSGKSTQELAETNQRASTVVAEAQQKLASDISKLDDIATKIDQLIATAGTAFTHLDTHQKSYLESLKKNVESLASQMTTLLTDYAEQANAQTENHLGVWAEHTTIYAEKMNSAAQALSSVVDEIEMKLPE